MIPIEDMNNPQAFTPPVEGDDDQTRLLIEGREEQIAANEYEGSIVAEVDNEQAQAKYEQLEADTDAAYMASPAYDLGPDKEQYDYTKAVSDGAQLKPDEAGNVKLPNSAIKPDQVEIAGFDLTSGGNVRGRYQDTEGVIAYGLQGLKDSYTVTGEGAPVDDILSLAYVARGVWEEGDEFEDFVQAVPESWSLDQKRQAWKGMQASAFVENYEDIMSEMPAEEYPATEGPKYTEETLAASPEWTSSSAKVYEYWKGEPFQGSEQELHDWSLQHMSDLNNITMLGAITARVMSSPDEEYKTALATMLVQYENTDWQGASVWRTLKAMSWDATNYAGFGAGAIAGRFAVKAGQTTLKKLLSSFAGGAAAGSVMGSGFTAADDVARQTVKVEGGLQDEVDLGQTGQAALTGAALGGVLGGSIGVMASEPAIAFGSKLIRQGQANLRASGPSSTQMGRQLGSINPNTAKLFNRVVEDTGITPTQRKALAPELMTEEVDAFVDNADPAPPSIQVSRKLQEKALEANDGRVLTIKDDLDEIATKMAAEVFTELNVSGNASKWYRETLDRTRGIVAKRHPEIETDPAANSAFHYALAATSQGAKVSENAKFAEATYQHYKKTGKFSEDPKDYAAMGKEAGPIASNFKRWNAMTDKMGAEKFSRLLSTDFSMEEMKVAGLVEDYKGEAASEILPASVMMGPKIGGGFYTNLTGRWDVPTFDLWWMRTLGRHTGDMIKPQIAENITKAPKLITKNKANRDAFAKYGGMPDSLVDEKSITEWGVKHFGQWARDGHPDKENPVHKLSRAIASRAGARQAPAGGKERQDMRKLVRAIKDKVSTTGEELDEASIQALLWFPEQRLWNHLGSKQTGSENDYAKAFGELYGTTASDIGRTDTGAGTSAGQPLTRGVRNKSGQASLSEREQREVLKSGAIRTFRQRVLESNTGEAPRSHSGRSGSDGESVRVVGEDVPVVNVYDPSSASVKKLNSKGNPKAIHVSAKRAFEVTGITKEPIYEIADASAFHKALNKSKDSHQFGSSVYSYDAADYAGMRTFVMDDGNAGFAIKPDGDIVSVFSSSDKPANMHSMMSLAIEEGGRKLDAFDTILPDFYALFGMKPVAKVKWDDAQAPSDWVKTDYATYNKGEPDIVMMAYDPEYMGSANDMLKDMSYSDYDTAVKLQDEALNGGQ